MKIPAPGHDKRSPNCPNVICLDQMLRSVLMEECRDHKSCLSGAISCAGLETNSNEYIGGDFWARFVLSYSELKLLSFNRITNKHHKSLCSKKTISSFFVEKVSFITSKMSENEKQSE